VRFADVEVSDSLKPKAVGLEFLDRILGGGLPNSAATLLAGEPGIGKSTLLFQLFSKTPQKSLYVSAEESVEQVAARFKNHHASGDHLYILAESRLSEIVRQIEELKPERVAIDSIQMILADTGLEKSRGIASSVRETAEALVGLAKGMGFQLWIVGHITKDGEIAGPKMLEHLVDTVLTFSQSDEPGTRVLQVQKHRFGASGELALLSISEKGLAEKKDAEGFWMSKRDHESPGCAFVPVLFGSRVYCVEVQALATPTFYPAPRRSASGFDLNRLHLLCAVLEKHLGLSLSKYDIYLNVVGGIRIQDPVADLACAAAIVSSLTEKSIPMEIAFSGELGLTGEIRPSPQLPERSRLLERLGKKMLLAAGGERVTAGIRVKQVRHLRDALGSLIDAGGRQKNEGISTQGFE
jgi:DNA repair protein RadA/Sms